MRAVHCVLHVAAPHRTAVALVPQRAMYAHAYAIDTLVYQLYLVCGVLDTLATSTACVWCAVVSNTMYHVSYGDHAGISTS